MMIYNEKAMLVDLKEALEIIVSEYPSWDVRYIWAVWIAEQYEIKLEI